jgi:tRNA(fMet)-specific endonuclease VapC
MPRYLLDTNICIYIAKRKPPEVLARFESLSEGEVAMSLITFGELRYGANRSANAIKALETIEQLATAIPVVTPDLMVATHYGDIRARLTVAGTPIGNNDLWIAAHARSADLILVTNNVAEFRRVPGLRIENWVRDGGHA